MSPAHNPSEIQTCQGIRGFGYDDALSSLGLV